MTDEQNVREEKDNSLLNDDESIEQVKVKLQFGTIYLLQNSES